MWKRVFIWTCDSCSKAVEKHDYGLPKGWLVIPANVSQRKDTSHACCNSCAKPKLRLYIDDIRPVPPGFDLVARNYQDAVNYLMDGNIGFVSFDHDLGTKHTGYDIAKFIEQSAFTGTLSKIMWAIHSANPVGVKNITAAMNSADRLWEDKINKSHPIVE